MIRTINCQGSSRSSHTNARTDFLAIPRNGTNQSVSHVRLDGREYKQAKELIIYSQRTLSVLAEDGADAFDDLPGNDEALYTSPQVAPKVKLFLLQNGWTLGILSGDTVNTI